MAALPKLWTLSTLPSEAQDSLRTLRVLRNAEAYRAHRDLSVEDGLFAGMFTQDAVDPEVQETSVIWGTDDYQDGRASTYRFAAPLHDLSVIRPRVEKSQEEQRRRVKEKAEVFTPAWIVNLQNNLIDGEWLASGASFNEENPQDSKAWISTGEKVRFRDSKGKNDAERALRYIADRRLELCCGEGPYLFSPYDATSGTYLPVRNAQGHFQRVGILDRKLRVAHEQSEDLETWKVLAEAALRSTYGCEWQGDNLLLARLNMVNTYFDYLRDFCEAKGLPWPQGDIPSLAVAMADIASWQLWQMDGLKMVVPQTCSPECEACKARERTGHDGVLPVIAWGSSLKPFEDFLVA